MFEYPAFRATRMRSSEFAILLLILVLVIWILLRRDR